jgi:hypothetical protein
MCNVLMKFLEHFFRADKNCFLRGMCEFMLGVERARVVFDVQVGDIVCT